jgi:DNA-binding transcriptional regulator YbjK
MENKMEDSSKKIMKGLTEVVSEINKDISACGRAALMDILTLRIALLDKGILTEEELRRAKKLAFDIVETTLKK